MIRKADMSQTRGDIFVMNLHVGIFYNGWLYKLNLKWPLNKI
jgi:hypothetical protein